MAFIEITSGKIYWEAYAKRIQEKSSVKIRDIRYIRVPYSRSDIKNSIRENPFHPRSSAFPLSLPFEAQHARVDVDAEAAEAEVPVVLL